jgi:hypothetical protein
MGRGGSPFGYRAAIVAYRLTSAEREAITPLCREAIADMRLAKGRLAKYASDSAAGSFDTRPVIRTCRFISRQ